MKYIIDNLVTTMAKLDATCLDTQFVEGAKYAISLVAEVVGAVETCPWWFEQLHDHVGTNRRYCVHTARVKEDHVRSIVYDAVLKQQCSAADNSTEEPNITTDEYHRRICDKWNI